MGENDWDEQIERLDKRTAERRAKAKEQNDRMQEAIREAEERRDAGKPAE